MLCLLFLYPETSMKRIIKFIYWYFYNPITCFIKLGNVKFYMQKKCKTITVVVCLVPVQILYLNSHC